MMVLGGYVFISYSRTDRGYVEQLAACLADAGIPVWYDFAVEVGEPFGARIQSAIEECVAFLVVLTPASMASEWVLREIRLADRLKKPIRPLLRSACRTTIEIEGIQQEDVTGGRLPSDRFLANLRGLFSPVIPPSTDTPVPPSSDPVAPIVEQRTVESTLAADTEPDPAVAEPAAQVSGTALPPIMIPAVAALPVNTRPVRAPYAPPHYLVPPPYAPARRFGARRSRPRRRDQFGVRDRPSVTGAMLVTVPLVSGLVTGSYVGAEFIADAMFGTPGFLTPLIKWISLGVLSVMWSVALVVAVARQIRGGKGLIHSFLRGLFTGWLETSTFAEAAGVAETVVGFLLSWLILAFPLSTSALWWVNRLQVWAMYKFDYGIRWLGIALWFFVVFLSFVFAAGESVSPPPQPMTGRI